MNDTPPPRRPPPLVRLIESLLFGGRWLLAPLYLAMLVLLGLIVMRFVAELAHAVPQLLEMDETRVIMTTLSLIDLSLTANLIVLVILSGYENFVARIDLAEGDRRPEWMGNIDFGGLKLKMMGAITVIAAVHVLRVFLEVRTEADRVVIYQSGLMIALVLTGLLLALTDRIAGHD